VYAYYKLLKYRNNQAKILAEYVFKYGYEKGKKKFIKKFGNIAYANAIMRQGF
jgi:hypothetical protein